VQSRPQLYEEWRKCNANKQPKPSPKKFSILRKTVALIALSHHTCELIYETSLDRVTYNFVQLENFTNELVWNLFGLVVCIIFSSFFVQQCSECTVIRRMEEISCKQPPKQIPNKVVICTVFKLYNIISYPI
jgi:hypothetical protein